MGEAQEGEIQPGVEPRAEAGGRDRGLWFLALAAAVVVLDQATKWVMSGWLERGEDWPEGWWVHLTHVTNTGAAFGMFQGAAPILAVTSALGVAVVLIYLFNPRFAHPALRGGLALMLGGAAGNLIDRVRLGEVTDFIKFPNFPAFNVADSAITIGVLILVWAMLMDFKTEPAER